MKISFVVVLGLFSGVYASGAVKAVKSIFTGRSLSTRDVQLIEHVLARRDRTIQEWVEAVKNPERISQEMKDALKAKGYAPPNKVKRSPEGPTEEQKIAKKKALEDIKAGKPIPPEVIQAMKEAKWTGPNLKRREAEPEPELELEPHLELVSRDFDEDYLDFYARDVNDLDSVYQY